MIVTPVAKVPRALRKSRVSKPSPEVAFTGAAWLPGCSGSGSGISGLRAAVCSLSVRTSIPTVFSERHFGRQAQRYPAINRAIDVPGEGVMGIGRMDVAESALDRVLRIDRAAAACAEQNIDRPGTQCRGKGTIAAIARLLLEARHHPGLGDPRRLVAIAQRDRLGGVGRCRRLGEMHLQVSEIGEVPSGIDTEPGSRRLREVL